MQRLNSIRPESAQGTTKELLSEVHEALGSVPNVAQVMASSPAVLAAFLGFSKAMGDARIGGKLHNQVKLATSETNSCAYCTSILTAGAAAAGLSADDIVAGRTGRADDERTDAALKFAEAVLETRGKVTDGQLSAVRDTGFDDGQIVEIVASVVLGCFTNFLNNVADTELDVPAAEPVAVCATDDQAANCGCTA